MKQLGAMKSQMKLENQRKGLSAVTFLHQLLGRSDNLSVWLFIGAGGGVCLAWCFLCWTDPSCGPQSISRPHQGYYHHNLGCVLISQDENISHDFRVTNPLPRQAMLLKVERKSCSCILEGTEVLRIGPGETSGFRVTMNTGYARSHVQPKLLLSTGTQSIPYITLTLEADVYPRLQIVDGESRHSRLAPGQKEDMVWTVVSYDKSDSEENEFAVHSYGEGVEARITNLSHDMLACGLRKNTIHCVVSSNNALTQETERRVRFSGRVDIQYGAAKVTKPVSWSSLDAVEFSPRQVFLIVKGDQTACKQVCIRFSEEVTVLDVVSNHEFLAISTQQSSNPNECVLSLSIVPNRRLAAEGSIRSIITATTDNAKLPTIMIPVVTVVCPVPDAVSTIDQ